MAQTIQGQHLESTIDLFAGIVWWSVYFRMLLLLAKSAQYGLSLDQIDREPL